MRSDLMQHKQMEEQSNCSPLTCTKIKPLQRHKCMNYFLPASLTDCESCALGINEG